MRIFQPIVAVERSCNGHTTYWLEVLACGHTGQQRRDRATVEQAMARQAKRACYRCTKENLQER